MGKNYDNVLHNVHAPLEIRKTPDLHTNCARRQRMHYALSVPASWTRLVFYCSEEIMQCILCAKNTLTFIVLSKGK
jgi:hypothetical protein